MTPRAAPISWVFFDVGGTLFDLLTPQPAFGEALAARGLSVPWSVLEQALQQARRQLRPADHVGPPTEYRIDHRRARARRARFLEALLDELAVPECDRDAARRAVEAALAAPGLFGLYPDAVPTLRVLRVAGFRLGVISNWDAGLPLLCRHHGLDRYFELILASEAEGFAKPGRHLFERALERAGAPAGATLYVGDSLEEDIHGAAAVGLRPVLLDRGGYYPRGTWLPTIHSLDELPRLVDELARAYSH